MSRSLLHKTKLEPFKAWLSTNEIPHRPGRGDYQVLQVWHRSAWHSIFDRIVAPEHYTVASPLEHVVRRFIRSASDISTTR